MGDMQTSSADERINRLRELTEALDTDNKRQDKASMMKILSQEFARHIKEGKKCKKDEDLGGAEAHRLISESIHRTLKTFETIQE
jgi:hypothetical protein